MRSIGNWQLPTSTLNSGQSSYIFPGVTASVHTFLLRCACSLCFSVLLSSNFPLDFKPGDVSVRFPEGVFDPASFLSHDLCGDRFMVCSSPLILVDCSLSSRFGQFYVDSYWAMSGAMKCCFYYSPCFGAMIRTVYHSGA